MFTDHNCHRYTPVGSILPVVLTPTIIAQLHTIGCLESTDNLPLRQTSQGHTFYSPKHEPVTQPQTQHIHANEGTTTSRMNLCLFILKYSVLAEPFENIVINIVKT